MKTKKAVDLRNRIVDDWIKITPTNPLVLLVPYLPSKQAEKLYRIFKK